MAEGSRSVAVLTFNSVPARNPTWKYERLGRMAMENRRQYCARHGYTFVEEMPAPGDRPACWAKIPALLAALETHEWALWADSDTLVFEPDRRLEPWCDPGYDLVVQSHDEHFRRLGVDREAGLARMPINTGVFLMRRSEWSFNLLRRSYEQVDLVCHGETWNGIGEQEAMTRVLLQDPTHREHILYVDQLQNHPLFYRRGDLFVHFYGNHARHRIEANECEETIGRWERLSAAGLPFPDDRCRFHWCCIQNKDAATPSRGDVQRYWYTAQDLQGPRPHGGDTRPSESLQ